MKREEIIAAALAAEPKVRIEEYREAVDILRDKGYTWREIAEFLNHKGIQTDHTRVYRTFGKTPKQHAPESREIQIDKIIYKGIRKTKRNNAWNVLELDVPSKLDKTITLIGHSWGAGAPDFALTNDNEMTFRKPKLVIKSGDKFPMACISLELALKSDSWSHQDVYIMPKWHSLI